MVTFHTNHEVTEDERAQIAIKAKERVDVIEGRTRKKAVISSGLRGSLIDEGELVAVDNGIVPLAQEDGACFRSG